MKILFVIYHGLGFGGAEVSTKYLAEGLKKRGHEIIFVSNGHYEGFKNYILKSYTFLPFSLQRRYVRKIVKRVIKEENPDIVHAHDRLTSVGAVQAARSLKVPVVVHFRDYWFACPRSSCMAPDGVFYEQCTPGIVFKHYPAKRWLLELYKLFSLRKARRAVNQADVKFCNGLTIQRRLKECGIHDAEVLPILRDMSMFSLATEKGAVKREYCLKPRVVSFVGGLTLSKGIMFLAEVFSEIAQEHRDWCLCMVGGGPLKESLQWFIRERGLEEQILVLGKVPLAKMPLLYADTDIVVFPSLWEEPLSGVLLEAGASGKPVIASDRGESKEILVHGETGLIVAVEKEAWKKAIQMLMEKEALRKKMGAAARKRITQDYSLEHVSGIVEKKYQELLRGH